MGVVNFPGKHPTVRAQARSSDGGGGDDMEARVAKLESDVENIKTNVADIKTDVREIRGKVDDLKDSIASTKIWALMLYIALAGTLLLVMAKGFKWL
jgi:t-SNARE complex subunit (syntaxin)